jgi:hypothetical protein
MSWLNDPHTYCASINMPPPNVPEILNAMGKLKEATRDSVLGMRVVKTECLPKTMKCKDGKTYKVDGIMVDSSAWRDYFLGVLDSDGVAPRMVILLGEEVQHEHDFRGHRNDIPMGLSLP